MHPRSARSDRTDRSTDRPTDDRLFCSARRIFRTRSFDPLGQFHHLSLLLVFVESLCPFASIFSPPLHYLFILFFLPLFLSCYERNFGERATSRRALRGIRVTKIIGESGAGARRGWEEAARGGTGVVRLIGNAAVAMHKRRQFKGERGKERKRGWTMITRSLDLSRFVVHRSRNSRLPPSPPLPAPPHPPPDLPAPPRPPSPPPGSTRAPRRGVRTPNVRGGEHRCVHPCAPPFIAG